MIRWRRTKQGSVRGDRHGCGFLRLGEVAALLEGDLRNERRTAFEQHVSEGCGRCALLAADLEVYRAVLERGALDLERREFEAARISTLSRLREEAESMGPAARHGGFGRMTRSWRLGAAAAAAATLVALLVWTVLQRPSGPPVLRLPRGGQLAVEAMPFSPPPLLRGEETAQDLWNDAREAYESGRYRAAARHLRVIEQRQPDSSDATLYLGISELMAGRFEEARTILARSREKAAARDLPQAAAAWYEALAALAEGDHAQARRSLAAAADEGGLYAERARKLLRDLPGG